ncbi:16S rRNA (cytosine(1402)-N(4))-methyltransferase RsmH [candidate division KSB1 bacterium]|nr:16S rRNA (cytosine(1402)-N(4))-methyltransferase RsmH [candidate division KSB1 bacterium]
MEEYNYHAPVLLNEVIQYLVTNRSGVYVDCTLGGAGHSLSILKHLDQQGLLIGIDRDEEAIEYARKRLISFENQIILVQTTFSELSSILTTEQIKEVDGILLDLGISSRHIDSIERGFSYLSDAPLDMRMDSGQGLTAETVINEYSSAYLKQIFKEYGEEKFAGKIAAMIDKARQKQRIRTTGQLAEIIFQVVPYKMRMKSAARIFQSVRIFINDELTQLRNILTQILPCLKLHGRAVTLAYNSLEDRMIKEFMQEKANPCICPPDLPVCACGRLPQIRILTRKAIQPSEEELARNPRSRSVRMRCLEKIA